MTDRLWDPRLDQLGVTVSKLGPFELDTIVVGDCLDVMRQMPDGCVDAVIADPPYGVGAGEWDVWNAELAAKWVAEMQRINSGSLYIFFVPKKHLGELLRLMPDDIHILVWCKNTGLLHRYAKEWEWFWEAVVYHRGNGVFNKPEGTAIRDWTICPTPWAERDEKLPFKHKAQKPKKLIAKYILASSNPGDLIFDPFMGSGTTAVAAKKLSRHYFGCDINPEYVEMARQRVAKVDGVQLELLR